MVRAKRMLPLCFALLLWGCSSPKKSASELDAEINKIQNDPSMPQQAKAAVLNNLQRERDTAGNTNSAGK